MKLSKAGPAATNRVLDCSVSGTSGISAIVKQYFYFLFAV